LVLSPTTDKLNHLLPAVAIHSVAISGKTLFMPDLSSAFTKASLEIHALLTSPSYRYRISKCSMVLQKQEMYSIRLSSTWKLQRPYEFHSFCFRLRRYFLSLSYSWHTIVTPRPRTKMNLNKVEATGFVDNIWRTRGLTKYIEFVLD